MPSRFRLNTLASVAAALVVPLIASAATLEQLAPNAQLHGFIARAAYIDDAGKRMGARFVHRQTGFTLDLLRIESVPQAYVWVNTYPTSDMGEPHTQEHLLLGHGNKGRTVAGIESMSMIQHTAYTMQRRTVYEFNSPAGATVFYESFERKMDALLHPDYTDEEIRREVRNFGVSANADQTLRLEEKGSVYNEMVSSMVQPNRRVFRSINQALYGVNHPLAYNAGGMPEAIRIIKPENIRKFHADHYHLPNMGAIVSLPSAETLDATLQKFDAALLRLEPKPSTTHVVGESDLPAMQPAKAGEIRLVSYPNRNEQQPGLVMMAWPANHKLTPEDKLWLNLFLDTFAGDPTTNVYNLFIDAKTRKLDIGAKTVFNSLSDEVGHPILIGLNDVTTASMTPATLQQARDLLVGELKRVAELPAGSPEIAEFNRRAKARLVEMRRDASYLMNTPPQFGFRSGSRPWMSVLTDINEWPAFEKQVTQKDALASIEKALDSNNPWQSRIAAWRLTEDVPYIGAAKADPGLITADETERKQRAAAETARLREFYKSAADQEAILRYRTEYDANTATIEKSKQAVSQKFLDKPPLTLDDLLRYQVTRIGALPAVTSTIPSMTSGMVGLAFDARGIAPADLVYLSALPGLLTQTGVVRNGQPVSYNDALEQQRKEILGLSSTFSTNLKTGRTEVVIRGSGNTAAETEKAIEWMRLSLLSPNWRKYNLPRLRDYIDQQLSAARRGMQRPEEYWVNEPANSWIRQEPVYLTAANFMTRAYFLHRLKWMLKDEADRAPMQGVLTESIAAAGQGRAALRTYLAAHTSASGLAGEAAKDLEQMLADLPDDSLAADWSEICRQMQSDVAAGAETTLAHLDRVRQQLLHAGGARVFLVGSEAAQAALKPAVESLVKALPAGDVAQAARQSGTVAARIKERTKSAVDPVFVGLLAPQMNGGVILNSVEIVDYSMRNRDELLDYLTSLQFSGSGPHTAFMRTWGAGLAYSNGLRGNVTNGRLIYYAERTPELPQTLKFVVDLVKTDAMDPNRPEYAIAQAFTTRAQDTYERRAEAMADDIADGITSERVSAFRTALLQMRQLPTLSEELHARARKVFSPVLPGLQAKATTDKGASYFVIGPERQLALYEEYLKGTEGSQTKLFRLYPRDFWITDAAATQAPGRNETTRPSGN